MIMEQKKIEKPFLKWVGGKTQIINSVLEYFPAEIDTYYEPFLGGGSVLFGVLSLQKNNQLNIKKIVASDANSALIAVYNNIKNNYKLVLDNISILIINLSIIKLVIILSEHQIQWKKLYLVANRSIIGVEWNIVI